MNRRCISKIGSLVLVLHLVNCFSARGEQSAVASAPRPLVLRPGDFWHFIDTFNGNDHELYRQHISNAAAWEFLKSNLPLLDCPDREIEQIYNRSTFCDLVISGLIGLRPRADDTVELNPLVPEGTWDYFCLDQVRYHDHCLTILYDRTGERYHRGAGLRVYADGRAIAIAESLTRVNGRLGANSIAPADSSDCTAGWSKTKESPLIGGKFGTCFDIAVLRESDVYRMWLSWRPKAAVALVSSRDGIHWSEPPQAVLGPRAKTGWEDDINRPVVLKQPDGYHMWYTGQSRGHSSIGYATSADGVHWDRRSDKPVLSADRPWEKVAVMCPHVIWDEECNLFKMWYSGGEQNEPNAIGYATSADGLNWAKSAQNPIFTAEAKNAWEKHKVTACQVIKQADGYTMFYIGFENEQHAQICLARSKDGVTRWQRHPANPIIRTSVRGTGNDWDCSACYKPYAIFDGKRWLLWYNGRRGSTPTAGGGLEQIGAAMRVVAHLGFGSW